MKYILLLLLITGCSTWLRYDWESAVNNLPPNSKVIKVNNDFITYSLSNSLYQVTYSTRGELLKTTLLKK